MSESKNKELRKEVYKDLSQRGKRTYIKINIRPVSFPNGQPAGTSCTLINDPTSLRAKYQTAKRSQRKRKIA
jgi:hypothetical protein